MEAAPSLANDTSSQSKNQHRNYHRKNKPRNKPDEASSSFSKPDTSDDQRATTRRSQQPASQITHQYRGRQPTTDGNNKKSTSSRVVEGGGNISAEHNTKYSNGEGVIQGRNEGKRSTQPFKSRLGKAKFNAGLTEPTSTQTSGSAQPRRRPKKTSNQADADDLTSHLIRELSTYPYPDCLICFSSIHPKQPTWSCSPLIPMLETDPAHQSQYCWTTFHLKCIRDWAEKNYKEVKAAWEAREEFGKDGEWRCPGCQGKRNKLIKGYMCFCGSTRSPSSHLGTPHSCGNACSRPRTSCSHPCPLLCHPGPCPPCKIILDIPCACIRKQTVSVRCGESTQVSCGQICSKMLDCGKHQCQQTCHPGACSPCERKDNISCWCEREQKVVSCGEGDVWAGSVGCDDRSTEYMQEPRKGFGCRTVCGKSFDCGSHHCMKSCHPPASHSQLGHCPVSPDRITTCPCGKQPIASSSSPGIEALPVRLHCTDPIPTCASVCLKHLPYCEHQCQAKCHTSTTCPPCSVDIVRPCRCGSTIRTLKCGELHVLDEETGLVKEQEILCERPCMAMRACGKHQCHRVCCPLASVAKGKMKAVATQLDADPDGLHECDRACGKMLSCGNHRCEERDHRGPCHPCLRSSFEELICFCGRTVQEPPIPCGTKIHCSYPCSLPPPPCGHPPTPHTCHFPDTSCPPCVHLTEKLCACGKKILPNIRCSLDSEKVSCGLVCGKLLSCGGHKCDRKCHAGECGACTSMCGKARKLCLPDVHPCTNLCHAPTSCNEDEPCQTRIELTCECGRIRQAVACGKCISSPAGSAKGRTLKCTTECAIKKRNARLADALGIKPGEGGLLAEVTYSDELVAFARANSKFLKLVEDALADFVRSSKTNQVLPPMPHEKRNFVSKLVGLYRMDSHMVGQDPHRSVQLSRRIDTRIPTPLLSTFIANKFTSNSTQPNNLGKLGNLRGGLATPRPTSVNDSVKPSPSTAGALRGWTAVVAPAPTVDARANTPNVASASASRVGSPAPSRPLEPGPVGVPHNASPQIDSSHEFPKEAIPDNWEDDV
ncbi:hypothetical protein EV360DRAFT_55073 [Lentinula raphanica]|nr:hypothetical protein EV360DRAFT_55073 [Lentinula raphanica]